MSDINVIKNPETRELTFERVFDAPREKVWAAWTDAEQLAMWWGPRGWETTSKEFDFKPGGVWVYGMKCVDENQGEWYGKESWGKSVYKDINEPESFTYTDYFINPDGTVQEEMPVMNITMQFIDMDGKTKVVSRTVFDTEEDYNKIVATGVVQGVTETWDRLEELVAKA